MIKPGDSVEGGIGKFLSNIRMADVIALAAIPALVAEATGSVSEIGAMITAILTEFGLVHGVIRLSELSAQKSKKRENGEARIRVNPKTKPLLVFGGDWHPSAVGLSKSVYKTIPVFSHSDPVAWSDTPYIAGGGLEAAGFVDLKTDHLHNVKFSGEANIQRVFVTFGFSENLAESLSHSPGSVLPLEQHMVDHSTWFKHVEDANVKQCNCRIGSVLVSFGDTFKPINWSSTDRPIKNRPRIRRELLDKTGIDFVRRSDNNSLVFVDDTLLILKQLKKIVGDNPDVGIHVHSKISGFTMLPFLEVFGMKNASNRDGFDGYSEEGDVTVVVGKDDTETIAEAILRRETRNKNILNDVLILQSSLQRDKAVMTGFSSAQIICMEELHEVEVNHIVASLGKINGRNAGIIVQSLQKQMDRENNYWQCYQKWEDQLV